MKRYFIIFLFCIFILTGCAGLNRLVTDIKEIKESGEATQVLSEPVSAIAMPFIPQPYQIPASIFLGYVIALVRRWYKKKQGSVNA